MGLSPAWPLPLTPEPLHGAPQPGKGEALPGVEGRGGAAGRARCLFWEDPGAAQAQGLRPAEGFQLSPVAPLSTRGLFPSQLLYVHFLTLRHCWRVAASHCEPYTSIFKSKLWSL